MMATITCPKCVGSGEVQVPTPWPNFGGWPFMSTSRLIRQVDGGGYIFTCPACGGSGKQETS